MTLDDIKPIEDAELAADNEINRARKQAQQIIDDANTSGVKLLNDTENEAKTLVSNMLAAAEKNAEACEISKKQAVNKEIQEFSEKSKLNLEKAIDFIIGKAVKN